MTEINTTKEELREQVESFVNHPLAGFDPYEHIAQRNKDVEFERVLSGDTRNPGFDYYNASTGTSLDFAVDMNDVRSLEATMYGYAENDTSISADANSRAVADKLAKAYMIRQSQRLVMSEGDRKEQNAAKFLEMSVSLYGEPEPERVERIARIERTHATRMLEDASLTEDARLIIEEYLDLLPGEGLSEDSDNEILDREMYRRVRERIRNLSKEQFGEQLVRLPLN